MLGNNLERNAEKTPFNGGNRSKTNESRFLSGCIYKVSWILITFVIGIRLDFFKSPFISINSFDVENLLRYQVKWKHILTDREHFCR